MKSKLILSATTLLIIVSVSSASPDFWQVLKEHYKIPEGSDAFKAQCLNCHTDVPKHNAFGIGVKEAMRATGSRGRLELAVLQRLHAADSDDDGFANGDELRRGFNPGSPESRPLGSPPKQIDVAVPPAGPAKDRPSASPSGSPDSPLLPRHSFHPVVVHFPIALFIFGAGLEFYGAWKRNRAIRDLAFWNLLFGTLATLGAILTGFVAAYRLAFPLTPGTPVFLHLSVGLAASLLMIAVTLWRRTGVVTTKGYWALLLSAALAVGAAGHFGGLMVYG